MPVSLPFAASSGRNLSDKPRRIPKSVQLACLDMIHQGIDLVAAARANGLRPDTLRRHLTRIETLGFIKRERKALRAALCSSNEFYLAAIRNSSPNEMARTKAISLLEAIDDEDHARPAPGEVASPGITIRIIASPVDTKVIDVTPAPPQSIEPSPAGCDPIFKLP
jgi:hypothetical protein